MWQKQENTAAERRRAPRIAPPGLMRIGVSADGDSIANAEILNISLGGAALRSQGAVEVGERLVFTTEEQRPPVLCKVLACEPQEDGWYHIRCKCILGGFDLPPE